MSWIYLSYKFRLKHCTSRREQVILGTTSRFAQSIIPLRGPQLRKIFFFGRSGPITNHPRATITNFASQKGTVEFWKPPPEKLPCTGLGDCRPPSYSEPRSRSLRNSNCRFDLVEDFLNCVWYLDPSSSNLPARIGVPSLEITYLFKTTCAKWWTEEDCYLPFIFSFEGLATEVQK